ncbi:MAG TPA: aldo/keto reductase [Solirubrobacteraceae bacterium]|nr:aldo/keto reductase [Solirubrobacteraceae bacterium]
MLPQARLGGSGLFVSRLALGMMSYGAEPHRAWALDERAAEPIVRRAIEAGFTFFDTADMYADGASEIVTGRLLRKLIGREQCVVATKVFYPTTPGPNGRGLSRKHVLASVDSSLERLGMDYVDLYVIHRFDPETPVQETMRALDEIVRSGKARYVGASAMRAWQFAKLQGAALRNGWTPFVSMQDRYNLLYREEEREMIPQCLDQGVWITPYSPLAQGYLAGTHTREGEALTVRASAARAGQAMYGRPVDFDIIDRVRELASARGVAPAQIALAWLLSKPGVTAPIIGATKIHHVDDAVAAVEVQLSDAEIATLEEPYQPREFIG